MSAGSTDGRYVLLLRGINVGGRNKIRMKDLARMLEEIGFDSVAWYIQSGNVVFNDASGSPTGEQETKIENALSERFKIEVPVMALTAQEFIDAVDRFPFESDDADKSVLVFLAGEGSAEWATRAEPLLGDDEKFDLRNGVVYLYVPSGLSKSKAAEALLSKPPDKVKATSRNWRTVNRILELIPGETTG